MAFELSRVLEGIPWDSVRDDIEGSPIQSKMSQSQEYTLPTAVGTNPVLMETAVDSNAHGATAGIPLAPVQHMAGVQMPPYYVNSPPYHAQNIQTALAAHGAGHSQVPAVMAPAQPLMFAQPNGQMMYMPMPPYYHQPSFAHAPSQQRLYPPVQNAYQPQFVLLSPDGKMAQVMPTVPQNFCEYRAPPPPPPPPPPSSPPQVRPVTNVPQQQTQQQPHLSNTEVSLYAGQQSNCVYLLPGSQLPQGMPFFPQGVRVTSHYTNSWMHEPPVKPPKYSCPSGGTPPSHSAQASTKDAATSNVDEKEAVDALSCPMCGEVNFASEDVLRSHLHAKHNVGETDPISLVSDIPQEEALAVSCEDTDSFKCT